VCVKDVNETGHYETEPKTETKGFETKVKTETLTRRPTRAVVWIK